MGVFNYILCEVPLPDGYEGEFQTKDLEPLAMNRHVITKSGRLFMEKVIEVIKVPKHERPFPDAPKGSGQSFIGSLRYIKTLEDSNFHGIFTFGALEIIGHEPDEKDKARMKPIYKSHDYEVKFTDGRPVDIKMMADLDYRLPTGILFP